MFSHTYTQPPTRCLSDQAPTHPSPPTSIPPLVYRIHRTSAQTSYHFKAGFSAKNHTTIVNYTSALSRFGLAHLNHQTNISSPFISVYDNLSHAQAVANYFAEKYKEDTFVVTVDTQHLARGPVFRAADLLQSADQGGVAAKEMGKGRVSQAEQGWLHHGEYLVMYRIPAQAIRDEVKVARVTDQKWWAPGVIGGS
jgi:hypothetical protein